MIDFLARFPSTNALCVTGILLALATAVNVFVGWHPPDGWLLFVAGFAGVGVSQFATKRLTQRDPPP
jgi:hypothetical protein